MNVPKGLTAAGRAAWREMVESLEALSVDPEAQAPRLRRYAKAVDVRARVEADWAKAGYPTITEGSQGQPVAHPALRELRDQARLIEMIAVELVPKGAAGWRSGVPRSPDRRAPLRRSGKVVPMRPPPAVARMMGDADADAV